MDRPTQRAFGGIVVLALVIALAAAHPAGADGTMVGPKTVGTVPYDRSPQEEAQEAIIIFRAATDETPATEDLILKVSVKGDVDQFAWVIPFPRQPDISKEDAVLFRELYQYVEARRRQLRRPAKTKSATGAAQTDEAEPAPAVDVLSRRAVGAYGTAVVKETKPGALNQWLEAEGYQSLGEEAEDVIGFYRRNGFVFACIKVRDAELDKGTAIDLHPLRFRFETGRQEGIFFPMKMTGLQAEPFDVNLYVFYRYWIDDKLSERGYEHRGFDRRYRDWDSPACTANAGKAWSNPEDDPFLRDLAHLIPNVSRLFQSLYPGDRFYLTSIEAGRLRPGRVRDWPEDLWLYPYYVRRATGPTDRWRWPILAGLFFVVPLSLAAVVLLFIRRRKQAGESARSPSTAD
ncbi:MAG: DUF2330 domain-containing protein [Planctomycetota bacterium]